MSAGPDSEERLMFGLYNLLLVLASPFLLVLLLAKKRCRPGLRQRLGWRNPAQEWGDGRTIWVHAVSMGEATAAVPLVQQLKVRYPDSRIVVSTVTETGRETVLRRLDGQAEHLYFPLREAAARGIPVILANGRLSTESFAGYLRLRPFFRRVLAAVTVCSMQTDRDVDRIIQLGADPDRVVRTGNLKYDQVSVSAPAVSGQIAKRDLGLTEREDLFVAGSTHPVEEEAVLDCYRRLLEVAPSLVLVLAPRHIERADAVCATARLRGFEVFHRTTLPGVRSTPSGPRVIVLDTRGELASLYREATLVFVGGSLVDVGGHSPLEPAAWGKAVVFGPHMDHFAEAAEQFLRRGAGIQVRDVHEMADAMMALLKDRAKLEERGKAAYQLVLENQGAVARTVGLIARVLG
jgi:3-deoxy-D-manno-octulosonic-acid transferase